MTNLSPCLQIIKAWYNQFKSFIIKLKDLWQAPIIMLSFLDQEICTYLRFMVTFWHFIIVCSIRVATWLIYFATYSAKSDLLRCSLSWQIIFYSPIAFDERESLWLPCLACVCVCSIVCGGDCVMVIHEPNTQIMKHTHVHNAVNRRVEATKLLSRWRQSDYSHHNMVTILLSLWYSPVLTQSI